MSESKTINPKILGRVYPATEAYTVGRESIREFAQAVKATNQLHFDLAAAHQAGYPDLLAPPTYAILLAQKADAALIQDPSAGIDFSRVVHADQRFSLHRPIFAGDVLTTEVQVDKLRMIGQGAMLTTREEIRDQEGNPVVTCLSSLLIRGED